MADAELRRTPKGMTYNELDHPRGAAGRFRPTGHAEPDIALAIGLSEADFKNHIRELSDGNVSVDRDLAIDGVQDYWRLHFNNEDDLTLHVVIPEEGEPFSVVDYGIHMVTYPDGVPDADDEDAPPARTACVLAVPADKRRGVDPEALARGFRHAGQYADPEWTDEDDGEDTGQAVWDVIHARLVADLGIPAI